MVQLSSAELLFQNQPAYRIAGKLKNEKVLAKKALLVYENDSEQLPQPLKEMLDKLVSACRLQPGEVEFLNIRYRYAGTSLGDWKNIFSPQIVLVFGNIPISKNILGLKKNSAYAFDRTQLISAEPLDKLNGNDKEKGALWTSLKKALKL